MKTQLRGHFRGRPAAVELQRHSVLLERSIKLLTDRLRFDHRLIHSLTFSRCLFLPVSAKSPQPQLTLRFVMKPRVELRATEFHLPKTPDGPLTIKCSEGKAGDGFFEWREGTHYV